MTDIATTLAGWKEKATQDEAQKAQAIADITSAFNAMTAKEKEDALKAARAEVINDTANDDPKHPKFKQSAFVFQVLVKAVEDKDQNKTADLQEFTEFHNKLGGADGLFGSRSIKAMLDGNMNHMLETIQPGSSEAAFKFNAEGTGPVAGTAVSPAGSTATTNPTANDLAEAAIGESALDVLKRAKFADLAGHSIKLDKNNDGKVDNQEVEAFLKDQKVLTDGKATHTDKELATAAATFIYDQGLVNLKDGLTKDDLKKDGIAALNADDFTKLKVNFVDQEKTITLGVNEVSQDKQVNMAMLVPLHFEKDGAIDAKRYEHDLDHALGRKVDVQSVAYKEGGMDSKGDHISVHVSVMLESGKTLNYDLSGDQLKEYNARQQLEHFIKDHHVTDKASRHLRHAAEEGSVAELMEQLNKVPGKVEEDIVARTKAGEKIYTTQAERNTYTKDEISGEAFKVAKAHEGKIEQPQFDKDAEPKQPLVNIDEANLSIARKTQILEDFVEHKVKKVDFDAFKTQKDSLKEEKDQLAYTMKYLAEHPVEDPKVTYDRIKKDFEQELDPKTARGAELGKLLEEAKKDSWLPVFEAAVKVGKENNAKLKQDDILSSVDESASILAQVELSKTQEAAYKSRALLAEVNGFLTQRETTKQGEITDNLQPAADKAHAALEKGMASLATRLDVTGLDEKALAAAGLDKAGKVTDADKLYEAYHDGAVKLLERYSAEDKKAIDAKLDPLDAAVKESSKKLDEAKEYIAKIAARVTANTNDPTKVDYIVDGVIAEKDNDELQKKLHPTAAQTAKANAITSGGTPDAANQGAALVNNPRADAEPKPLSFTTSFEQTAIPVLTPEVTKNLLDYIEKHSDKYQHKVMEKDVDANGKAVTGSEQDKQLAALLGTPEGQVAVVALADKMGRDNFEEQTGIHIEGELPGKNRTSLVKR